MPAPPINKNITLIYDEYRVYFSNVTILLHGSPYLPLLFHSLLTSLPHSACQPHSPPQPTQFTCAPLLFISPSKPVHKLSSVHSLLARLLFALLMKDFTAFFPGMITCCWPCPFLICLLCLHPDKPTRLLSLWLFAFWTRLSNPVGTLSFLDCWPPSSTTLLHCSLWIYLPGRTVYLILLKPHYFSPNCFMAKFGALSWNRNSILGVIYAQSLMEVCRCKERSYTWVVSVLGMERTPQHQQKSLLDPYPNPTRSIPVSMISSVKTIFNKKNIFRACIWTNSS